MVFKAQYMPKEYLRFCCFQMVALFPLLAAAFTGCATNSHHPVKMEEVIIGAGFVPLSPPRGGIVEGDIHRLGMKGIVENCPEELRRRVSPILFDRFTQRREGGVTASGKSGIIPMIDTNALPQFSGNSISSVSIDFGNATIKEILLNDVQLPESAARLPQGYRAALLDPENVLIGAVLTSTNLSFTLEQEKPVSFSMSTGTTFELLPGVKFAAKYVSHNRVEFKATGSEVVFGYRPFSPSFRKVPKQVQAEILKRVVSASELNPEQISERMELESRSYLLKKNGRDPRFEKILLLVKHSKSLEDASVDRIRQRFSEGLRNKGYALVAPELRSLVEQERGLADDNVRVGKLVGATHILVLNAQMVVDDKRHGEGFPSIAVSGDISYEILQVLEGGAQLLRDGGRITLKKKSVRDRAELNEELGRIAQELVTRFPGSKNPGR